MKLDEKTLRASGIAHAIRLGKCPAVGMVMSCTLRVEEIEEADFAAGRIEKAVGISEAVRYEFEVTAEDLAPGRRLINEQAAVYREPKLTTVKVDR